MTAIDDRAHQIETWRALTSGQRRRVIKDRKRLPRFGWPRIYPPEKDPLAPRAELDPRAALAEAVPAPVAPGLAF